MSDHKFVRNIKTGVVFGRTKQLDTHPECQPYWPEREKPVAAPKAAVVAPKTSGKKASERTTAAAAAAKAAADAGDAAAALEAGDTEPAAE